MDPPTVDEEKTPDFILSPFVFISNLLSNYGWYILIVGSVLYYIWTTKLKSKVNSVIQKNSPLPEHPNQNESIQTARKKLQDRYDNQTQLYTEKMKEIEKEKAEKLKELYKKVEKSDGHKLGTSSDSDNSSSKNVKKKLTPEYFPMMNAGPTCSFRSGRSSGARGGG